MIRVSRLAHVALRTAQVGAMETYFTDVLGLWACRRDPDGVVHLTAGGAGAFIELIPGDEQALDHVAFEVSLDQDAAPLAEVLADNGLESIPWERDDPCSAAALGTRDPEGNLLQLIVPDGKFVASQEQGPGIRPIKIGHVATRVSDVAAVASFYVDKLGFRWSDSIGEFFSFLRCNADHHAVNPLQAERPGHVHHIAFELTDFLHTQRAADRLAEKQIPLIWGPGRHGPGHNLFTYHLDPDGHIIELFAGIDRMSHEAQGYFDPRPWHTDRPQRPRMWDPESLTQANGWGIAPPDNFLA